MLSNIDIGIVLLFLAIAFFVGIYERGSIDLDKYLVNKRSTGQFALIATLVSTYIGSGYALGISTLGYRGGLLGLYVTISIAIGFLMMAKYFAGPMKNLADSLQAHTLGDLFESKYSKRAALVMAVIVAAIHFLSIALQLTAFSTFVSVFTNLDLTFSLVVSAGVVLVYSVFGGLHSDIRTDIYQFLVMLLMFVTFFVIVPGQIDIIESFKSLPTNYLTGTAYDGLVFVIAAIVIAIPFVFSSASIWQRSFAAKDTRSFKRALYTGAGCLVIFNILFMLIGVLGKTVFPDIDNPDFVPAHFIAKFFPVGLAGIMITGFLATIMSTADTGLIITASSLSKDVYKRFFKPDLSDKSLLKLTRWIVAVIGLVGFSIALFVPDILRLVINSGSIMLITIPALLGLFAKGSYEKSAFWSLVIGFVSVVVLMFFLPNIAFAPAFILAVATFLLLRRFPVSRTQAQS